MLHRKIVVMIVAALFASVVLMTPGSVATDVPGGHITTNTVWNLAGSPYNVLGTIYIDPGVKLSIDPGVVVNASAGITIYVDGMLNVSGSAAQKVAFSSTGAWNGIVINSTSSWTKVQYANLGSATSGITAGKTNLTLSHLDIKDCANCIKLANTTFVGDNLTITSTYDAVTSEYSQIDLKDSIINAGKGADSATGNGKRGGNAVTLIKSGELPPANGTTNLFNVTMYAGAGGNASNTSALAGDGGIALLIAGGIDMHVENSKLYAGNGGVASQQAVASGNGGHGVQLQGASYVWIRSIVYAGNGGKCLAQGGKAGNGGIGIDVSGANASSYLTYTGSKVHGGAGGEANATSSKGGVGGSAISFDSVGALEFELFSMDVIGGKGGDAKGVDSTPGDGGNALNAANIRRVFAYANVITGGQGGSVYDSATAKGGSGGIGLNIIYAENMYSELGLFTGGKGGDDHSIAGKGGGTGGEGVVVRGGKTKVEVGETDTFGGRGGDVYVNPNAPAGNGPNYATRFIGGNNVIIFEYATAYAGSGGRNLAGGSNGKAGNVTLFTVVPSKVILNGFYGVQGESDHCLMIYNTTLTMSGDITAYCKYGVIADAPTGGVTPSFSSAYDTFWKSEIGLLIKHGAKPTITSAIIKDNTMVGARLVEGSSGTWAKILLQTTPTGIHANGSSPTILESKLNATQYDIAAENGSKITVTNTTFSDAKVMVKDSSSKVMVKNYLDVAVVDRRWNAVPRPELWVYDGSTLVLRETLKKPGTRTGILLTDRIITQSGTTENKTSLKVIYRNWTFTAMPGPMNDVNMAKSHLEWLMGSGATPPRVNYTVPTTDEMDVPTGSMIKIAFSVPMNRTAVQDSMTMTGNVTPSDFEWSNDGKVVEYAVKPWLMPESSFEVTLNSSIAKDDIGLYLDGNPDGASFGHPEDDYIWSFSTGFTPNITVLGNDTAPKTVDQGQKLVPMLVTDLIADENPLLFQSITIDRAGTAPDSDVESVSLWLDANGNARWDLADNVIAYKNFTAGSAKFDIPNGLIIDQTQVDHLFVVVNVTGGALVGNTIGVKISSEQSIDVLGAAIKMPIKPLASFNATVGGDITPPIVASAAPTGSGIQVNTSIVVTFNEPMNWTSVKDSLTISPQVPLAFVVSGSSAVFTPTTPYKYGTTYSVTLSGSMARDLSSNLLDGNKNGVSEGSPIDDYKWTFNTPALPVGDIAGVVVDDIGAAIQNVTVTIGQKTGTTDAASKYTITSVPTGKYDVTFDKIGYQSFKASNIEIKTGTRSWLNVTMNLLAGGITGVISDSSGKGIEGVTVEIKEIPGRSTTTDAAGAYSFARVPIGNYTVIASKSDYKPASKNLSVKSGQISNVDLMMEKLVEETQPISPYLYAAVALGVLLLLVILYFLFASKKRPKIEEEEPVEEEKEEEKEEEDKKKEEENDEKETKKDEKGSKDKDEE